MTRMVAKNQLEVSKLGDHLYSSVKELDNSLDLKYEINRVNRQVERKILELVENFVSTMKTKFNEIVKETEEEVSYNDEEYLMSEHRDITIKQEPQTQDY